MRCLFEGKTVKVLYEKQHPSHLEDIVFNATEFKAGLEFRFFKSYNNKSRIGNGKLSPRISLQAFKEIKLGDVLAASSCFPAGFEPISFPDDFIHENTLHLSAYINEEKRKEIRRLDLQLRKTKDIAESKHIYREKERIKDSFNPSSGLMDGGIIDNQGIGSVQLVEKNRTSGEPATKENYHDLLIIADVASYFVTDFEFVEKRKKGESFLLSRLLQNITLKGIDILLLLCIAVDIFMLLKAYYIPATFFTSLLVLVLPFRLYIMLSYRKHVPVFFRSYLQKFRSVSVSVLSRFLKERISSVMIMVMEVFLKEIRGLRQEILFSDAHWKHRLISNFIYTFKDQNTKKSAAEQELNAPAFKALNKILKIEQAAPLLRTANLAAGMATTLWFDDDDKREGQLDNLIACGQFTTCYSILKYIFEIRKDKSYEQLSPTITAQIESLFQQCLADWEVFSHTPLFLIQKR